MPGSSAHSRAADRFDGRCSSLRARDSSLHAPIRTLRAPGHRIATAVWPPRRCHPPSCLAATTSTPCASSPSGCSSSTTSARSTSPTGDSTSRATTRPNGCSANDPPQPMADAPAVYYLTPRPLPGPGCNPPPATPHPPSPPRHPRPSRHRFRAAHLLPRRHGLRRRLGIPRQERLPGRMAAVPMIALNRWRMPLLFMISGIALGLARIDCTPWRFAARRCWRLLLPLAFGMFVVVAVQAYCEGLANGRLEPGFGAFLLRYWQLRPWPPGTFTGAEFGITWNHLWYLAYLWLYTMLLVALRPLRRLRAAERMAGWRWPDRKSTRLNSSH